MTGVRGQENLKEAWGKGGSQAYISTGFSTVWHFNAHARCPAGAHALRPACSSHRSLTGAPVTRPQDVLLSISKIVRENGASFASSLERENISPRQGETVPFPSNEADAAAPPATLHPEVAASVKSERPPPGFAPAESLDAESCR
eukprot:556338-Pleurochrysis_carterae.AAC.1